MRNFIVMVMICFCYQISFSQTCSVNVTTTNNATVCPGSQITLNATAIVTGSNQSFNFNSGTLPSGWATTGTTNYQNNTCGQHPSGTPYFWASTAVNTPQIITDGFDICTGGNLTFDMRYAIQGGAVPCEGPDEADEGVSIEYSLDNGATWVEFVYFRPDGVQLTNCPMGNNTVVAGGNTPFTTWNTFTIPIPAAAISTNTKFRWIQYNSSGGCCDNWGLDNIFVNAGPCLTTNLVWSTGETGVATTNQTVTTNNSCYTVAVYDDNDVFLCASQPICFNVFTPAINAGPDVSVCDGSPTTLSASGGTGYVWDNGVSNGVPFVPTSTQTYTVTGTDPNGCSASDNVVVTVNPLVYSNFSYAETEYCNSEQNPLPTISGTPGGTFSISPSTMGINATTGELNLASSTVAPFENYTITYNPPGVCGGPTSITVRVYSLPTANITGTTAVCQNAASPTLTLTGGNATAPYTFTYTINNGVPQTIVSTGTVATILAPTGLDGTFTYQVISVVESGTKQCSNVSNSTAVITVNPTPSATVTGAVTVCQNAPQPTVSFSGTGGTAPYTFTYSINGGANQILVSDANGLATVTAPTTVVGTFTYAVLNVVDASSTTCSTTSTSTTVIEVQQLPTATIVGTAEVCQNGNQPQVVFAGANGTAPYTFIYTINGGANQTVSTVTGNSVSVSAPTSVAGVFEYALVSVAEAGANNCSQTQTASILVDVNPLPTATITGTIAVCEGAASQTVTFIGADGVAPYEFVFTYNNGPMQTVVSTGNIATITVPTNVPGVHTYSLVKVTDASVTTCENQQTGSATVTVNALPTASIGGTTTVCQNANAPGIVFTGLTGTAPFTFTYSINGGANQTVTTLGTNSSVTITVPTTTSGTFTYSLVSILDASSTTCLNPQVGQAVVTVNPLPTATISGTATICRNDPSPVVTFTGANGTAPYTFSYILNGVNQTITSLNGNSVTLPISSAVAGNNVINLIGVMDASSTNCYNVQTGTVTVLIHELPTVIAGVDVTVCDAVEITLTASGATTYVWTPSIVNGVGFYPTQSQTYTVVGIDNNGCQRIDSLEVVVIPIPVVDFITNVGASCAPLNATVTNLSTGNLTNCSWSLSDGTIITGCGTQNYNLTTPGCFDMTLTVSTPEGCANTKTIPNFFCVYENPIADFTLSQEEVMAVEPQIDTYNTSSGATSYYWDFGDEQISTAFEPTHTFPLDVPGGYVVTLYAISSNGCIDSTSRFVRVKSDIIYYVPNVFTPNQDGKNETFKPIFSSGVDIYSYTMLIFNRWGEIMFETHDLEVGWDGYYLNKLMQEGVYSWKINIRELYSDKKLELVGHMSLIK